MIPNANQAPPNREQLKAGLNGLYKELLARKATLEEQMVETEQAITRVRGQISGIAEYEAAFKAEESATAEAEKSEE